MVQRHASGRDAGRQVCRVKAHQRLTRQGKLAADMDEGLQVTFSRDARTCLNGPRIMFLEGMASQCTGSAGERLSLRPEGNGRLPLERARELDQQLLGWREKQHCQRDTLVSVPRSSNPFSQTHGSEAE
jgi:hypothetical protein